AERLLDDVLGAPAPLAGEQHQGGAMGGDQVGQLPRGHLIWKTARDAVFFRECLPVVAALIKPPECQGTENAEKTGTSPIVRRTGRATRVRAGVRAAWAAGAAGRTKKPAMSSFLARLTSPRHSISAGANAPQLSWQPRSWT